MKTQQNSPLMENLANKLEDSWFFEEVRLYQKSDDDRLTELYIKCGMLAEDGKDAPIFLRSHHLADLVLVVDRGFGAEAVICFIKRSSSVLWAYNLVYDKAIKKQSKTTNLWKTAFRIAKEQKVDWLTAQPMARKSEALQRYFHYYGWFSYADDEIINPLPLCYKIWQKFDLNPMLPNRMSFTKESFIIENVNSRIIINKKDNNLSSFLGKQEIIYNENVADINVLFSNVDAQPQHLQNLRFFQSNGAISLLKSGFSLLQPWWTSISTEELVLPARDFWPWDEILNQNHQIEFIQHDGELKNRLNILQLSKIEFQFQFRGNPSSSYTRLLFESYNKPIVREGEIEIGDSILNFGELAYNVIYLKCNSVWRTFVFVCKGTFNLDVSVRKQYELH